MSEVESCEIEGRPAQRYPLAGGAALVLVPAYLSPAETHALRGACEGLPWEHKPIRGVPTRRANAWLSDDPGAVYRYSGQVWTPRPLPEALRHLGARLGEIVGAELNCALATSYPTGEATVGYHADNEAVFGRNPEIASVSLGATRVFQVVHRSRAKGKTPAPDLSIELGDGGLVIMRGTFQHEHLHALRAASARVGARVNLSYRRYIGPP
jgi:alkylated DNA repair dioxygenase AlkB